MSNANPTDTLTDTPSADTPVAEPHDAPDPQAHGEAADPEALLAKVKELEDRLAQKDNFNGRLTNKLGEAQQRMAQLEQQIQEAQRQAPRLMDRGEQLSRLDELTATGMSDARALLIVQDEAANRARDVDAAERRIAALTRDRLIAYDTAERERIKDLPETILVNDEKAVENAIGSLGNMSPYELAVAVAYAKRYAPGMLRGLELRKAADEDKKRAAQRAGVVIPPSGPAHETNAAPESEQLTVEGGIVRDSRGFSGPMALKAREREERLRRQAAGR